MLMGHTTWTTEVKLLQHKLRHPARSVDIIHRIKTESLISMANFADADYMAVFDKEKVAIYNANNTKVEVSNGAILRGWRCKDMGLWRIPLTEDPTNNNTDTVLSCKLLTKWLQG